MAGLRGFWAGLDGTEGGETEEEAFRPAPAAHTALEGAFHATDQDIWVGGEEKKLIQSEWNTSLLLTAQYILYTAYYIMKKKSKENGITVRNGKLFKTAACYIVK